MPQRYVETRVPKKGTMFSIKVLFASSDLTRALFEQLWHRNWKAPCGIRSTSCKEEEGFSTAYRSHHFPFYPLLVSSFTGPIKHSTYSLPHETTGSHWALNGWDVILASRHQYQESSQFDGPLSQYSIFAYVVLPETFKLLRIEKHCMVILLPPSVSTRFT